MSQDPVEVWREAMGQSTSARLREALQANDELAMEHAKCVLSVHRLHADLADVQARLAAARTEADDLMRERNHHRGRAEKFVSIWKICCRDREAILRERDGLETANGQLREEVEARAVELLAANAENERLRARLALRHTTYQLTEKGRAATRPDPTPENT
jgi:chromosome segregation ATPase